MLPPAKMILQFVIDISILYHKPISLNIFNSTLDWEIEMANTLFRTANEGGISVLTKQSSNVVAVEAFLCNDGKGRMISQSEVRLKRDNVYLIPKTIGDLRPNLNEEVFVYSLNGDVISIHEVYFIKGAQKFEHEVGKWSVDNGLLLHTPNMVERRRNFNGIQLASLMVSDIRPYTIKSVANNVQANEDFEASGISFDLLFHMEAMMNFTSVITYQEDRKFGTLLPNGSVDGMLRTLSQLEADFSPMPMSIYEDRILVCDFTVQFDNYVMGLVGQQNEKPEINYLAFLLLFNWDTWFVISMLLVAMASLLFLLGRHRENEKGQISIGGAFAFVSQFQVRLGSFSPLPVTSSTGKILCFSWAVAGLLIFEFYSALLTSYMTVSNPPTNITQLSDVVSQGHHLYFWRDSGVASRFSKAPEGTIEHEIWKIFQRQIPQTYVDYGKEVALLLMLNKHSLFFGNLNDLPLMPTSSNKLMFHRIREGNKLPSAFTFPKGSELIPFFNHFTIRLQETGILGHTLKKWKASSPNEHQQNDPWKIALPMKSVVFPFAVLFGAGVISMMTLVIEYFTTWTKKKKN